MLFSMIYFASSDILYCAKTDLINQLDIADGLKGVLISSGFTLKSLLNASASDFAILGIDPYVAMLVSNAIKKVTRHQHSLRRIVSQVRTRDDL